MFKIQRSLRRRYVFWLSSNQTFFPYGQELKVRFSKANLPALCLVQSFQPLLLYFKAWTCQFLLTGLYMFSSSPKLVKEMCVKEIEIIYSKDKNCQLRPFKFILLKDYFWKKFNSKQFGSFFFFTDVNHVFPPKSSNRNEDN